MRQNLDGIRNQRGVVLPLVVIAMASLIGMSALALDISMVFLAKTRIQNAMDAAALAGARTLGSFTGNTARAQADAIAAYGQYASQINFGKDPPALRVEFSQNLTPFTPGATGTNARFVRARLDAAAPVQTYLARAVPGIEDALDVNASAVAGPQFLAPPDADDEVCDLAPFAIGAQDLNDTNCTDAGCFGYTAGQVVTIRREPNKGNEDNGIGPGNYQIVALPGSRGGNDTKFDLAGGKLCSGIGRTVETEPGLEAGPVRFGLNTRFNQYGAGLSEADGRPDIEIRPSDYATYSSRLAAAPNPLSGSYITNGIPRRRVLSILVADPVSLAEANGRKTINIVGIACVFLREPAGGPPDMEITAEFIANCDPGGLSPGVTPPSSGFFEIVLYNNSADDLS